MCVMSHRPEVIDGKGTHMRDMTHTHLWNDSFICVTKLIAQIMRKLWERLSQMSAHSYVWNGLYPFICVTWSVPIRMCDMVCTHSYVWHGLYPFICVTRRVFIRETWLLFSPGSITFSCAQGWNNRTLISHEPLVCSKMCFSKTEPVQQLESNNKSEWYNSLVTFISK